MKIRNTVLSMAAATLLAPAVFAATTKTADCASLEKQVDAAIAANSSGPSVAQAREHQAQGAKLCKEGKRADGMKQLREAMKDAAIKAK